MPGNSRNNARKGNKRSKNWSKRAAATRPPNVNSMVNNARSSPQILGTFKTIGFPDEYRCTLKYSMSRSMGGSTGAIIAQEFRANSLFDPDFTNAGHQPDFFDQLSLVYGRYYVKAAQIRCQFVNTSATMPIRFIVTASDQSISALGNMDNLDEAVYSKQVILPSINSPQQTVTSPMLATSKMMGQKETEPDDNMYAAVGANPTDVWWYEINAQSIDLTSTSFGYVLVTMLFECMFKDLTTPASS